MDKSAALYHEAQVDSSGLGPAVCASRHAHRFARFRRGFAA